MRWLLLLCVLEGCAVLKILTPPEPKVQPMTIVSPRDTNLLEWRLRGGIRTKIIVATNGDTTRFVEHLKPADGYITGRITELDPDWTYDDPCGLVLKAMHGCDGTSTFRFRVEGNGVGKWLWVFVPSYGHLPLAAGQDATFVYHIVWASPFLRCRQQMAAAGSSCGPQDNLPVVLDSLDIVPRGDSALVAWLFSLPNPVRIK